MWAYRYRRRRCRCHSKLHGSYAIRRSKLKLDIVRIAERQDDHAEIGEFSNVAVWHSARVATDYTTLAEDMASHGYVVVGSTPTYSANLVVFPDGRVARSTPQGSIPEDSPAATRMALERLINVWAADDQFVLDQITRLNAADPDGRFSGRLDMAAVGVLGHSFGGAAAAQVCHVDKRCKAGVDLDGSPYGDVVQTGLQQPFMFIWSESTDPADPESQQSARDTQTIYSRLTRGYQITIMGARHFNFADMAVLYAPAAKLLGVLGPIDGQRGLAITTAYVRAFFDRYLKHAGTSLLDGPAQDYPEVRFENAEQRVVLWTNCAILVP